jgi:SAM-dependent methyltransferase
LKYRGDPTAWKASIAFLQERMELEKTRVLDIGFGSGGFSLALAQHAHKVVNFDIRLNETRNFRNVVDQDNIDNILVSRADANNMPYRERSFDLVVLNGVLEYTANGQEGAPREVHVNVLKNVRNILRPGGWLYLGIENRYYLKFLLGFKAHEDMRFATVLPRGLANFLSKTFNNREFRNYVYSYNEYSGLLGDAGFDHIEFYTALPSYKLPEYILPIDDKEEIKQKIQETNAKAVYRYASYILAHSNYLYKKIGPDFVILCRA